MLSRNFKFSVLMSVTASFVLSAGAVPSGAAPAQQARPIAASATANKTILGTGDVLSVVVQKHADWSAPEAMIGGDGKIQVPVVGSIQASGRSLAQIDAEVTKKLKKRLRHPDVTVSIRSLRPRYVTLQGAIEKPSNYEMAPTWRVSDAIAAAGGLRFRTDLTSATLSRVGRRPIELDLVKVLQNDPAANLELRPSDRLNFVARTVSVQVAGQVNNPGPITVPIGQGVVEALSLAGGAKPNAALSKTSIQRGRTTIPVDLHAAITLGQKDVNRPVQEGDLILVPESTDRVTVTGAVVRPGYIDVPDGRNLRLSEALAQAGGPVAGAALTKAVITHVDGKSSLVDLYRVTIANDQAANVFLQPGDIVTVPQARGITINGAGAIKTPGTYVLEEGSSPRVSDALARAGGLTMSPDSVRISILRTLPDGKQLTLDVDPVALIQQGDNAQNARVMDGDLINVGSTLRTVYINGVTYGGANTVRSPGAYELKPGDGLQELLARAGGVTENASLSRVQVARAGKVVTVNALAGKNPGEGQDFELQAGDNVTIPVIEARVAVPFSVNKPGIVLLPEDRTLTIRDVLAMVGGPVQGAKIKSIALYRIGPDSKLQTHMVALQPGSHKKGQVDVSMPVQNGDYIYVPPGETGPKGFQKITSMLSPLALLGRLF